MYLKKEKKAGQCELSGSLLKNILNGSLFPVLLFFHHLLLLLLHCFKAGGEAGFLHLFRSFFFASNCARRASSLVALRMMSVVTTLMSVEMK